MVSSGIRVSINGCLRTHHIALEFELAKLVSSGL